ncbi:MAG: glycosyltransferase [Phycisphaerae bacterium]
MARLSCPTDVIHTDDAGGVRGDRIGVLLLTSSLERGGAEQQVVQLANGLDSERFRVYVCSLSAEVPLASDLRDGGACLSIVQKRYKYDVTLIPRVARLIRKLRVEVVHSFMFDAEIVGRLAGRLAGVPAVICSNRCPHLKRTPFKLWLARVTRPCFDMMIANSHAGLTFERTCQGVRADKLRLIPNGVDTQRFRPGNASMERRALGIPEDSMIVGMFAHFRGNKDYATLLDAAARVLKTRDDVVFVCAGRPDGEGRETMFGRAQSAVAAHGMGDRVRFLGLREDLDELYRLLDVKVLSTRFEGTPNVVLEAMASAVPVVATDVSDNARIVLDGRTGFIVPPESPDVMAERIMRLLDDPVLRRSFGAAARHRVETEYSVETLGRRTAESYLSVLERKGRTGSVDAATSLMEGGA